MSKTDNHANYQKYKEHPVVLALLEIFHRKTATTIPDTWRKYIRESTKDTDSVILFSQLRKWGIKHEVDTNLRGEELLSCILEDHIYPTLMRADDFARVKKVAWPRGLELAMIDTHQLPSPNRLAELESGNLSISTTMEYRETGTLRYFTRRKVQGRVSIPPKWILENCKPEVSTAEMMERFFNDFSGGFMPEDIPPYQKREMLKDRMAVDRDDNGSPADWDPVHLTCPMTCFPQMISIVPRLGDPPTKMEIYDVVPDEIKTEKDIKAKQLTFLPPMKNASRPLDGHMQYPVRNPALASLTLEISDILVLANARRNSGVDPTVQRRAERAVSDRLRDVYHYITEAKKCREALDEAKTKAAEQKTK
ncbi:MAG: hypothetical protein ACYTEQ_23225 [Planctomycetota bacterium]|jgi:hypothetical protein